MIIISLYHRISQPLKRNASIAHFTISLDIPYSCLQIHSPKQGLKIIVLQNKNKCSGASTDFADTKPRDEEITYS